MKRKNLIKLSLGLSGAAVLAAGITVACVSCSSNSTAKTTVSSVSSVANTPALNEFASDFDKAGLNNVSNAAYDSAFANYFNTMLNAQPSSSDSFAKQLQITNTDNNISAGILTTFQNYLISAINKNINSFSNTELTAKDISNSLKVLAVIPTLTQTAQSNLNSLVEKLTNDVTTFISSMNTSPTKLEDNINTLLQSIENQNLNLNFNIQVVASLTNETVTKTINGVKVTIPSLFSTQLSGFNFSGYNLATKSNISLTDLLPTNLMTSNYSAIPSFVNSILQTIFAPQTYQLIQDLASINNSAIKTLIDSIYTNQQNDQDAQIFNDVLTVLNNNNQSPYPTFSLDGLTLNPVPNSSNTYSQTLSTKFISNFKESVNNDLTSNPKYFINNSSSVTNASTLLTKANIDNMLNNLKVFWVASESVYNLSNNPINSSHYFITFSSTPTSYTLNGVSLGLPNITNVVTNNSTATEINSQVISQSLENLQTLIPLTSGFTSFIQNINQTALKASKAFIPLKTEIENILKMSTSF